MAAVIATSPIVCPKSWRVWSLVGAPTRTEDSGEFTRCSVANSGDGLVRGATGVTTSGGRADAASRATRPRRPRRRRTRARARPGSVPGSSFSPTALRRRTPTNAKIRSGIDEHGDDDDREHARNPTGRPGGRREKCGGWDSNPQVPEGQRLLRPSRRPVPPPPPVGAIVRRPAPAPAGTTVSGAPG